MNRFDEAVTAAEEKHREAMRLGSADLAQAIHYARQGIDPQMPLFSGMNRNV